MTDPSLINFYYSNEVFPAGTYQRLRGINNLTISDSKSFNEPYLLGGSPSLIFPNAPAEFNLSFDRSFISKDALFPFTGLRPMKNAYIKNGDSTTVTFLCDLYLTNYSAGFSIGELPVINTKFVSYSCEQKIDTVNKISAVSEGSFALQIPTLSSITIAGPSSNEININNNIYSFDYSLEIKREPFFSVGQYNPYVQTILPIIINFSVNSKVYSSLSEKYIPKYQSVGLYNFQVCVCHGVNDGTSFPITNATLISTDIQYSSTNTTEIKRTFRGYYGI